MEMTAVGYLLERDAHFVLYRLDDPKKPAWRNHNKLRPTIEDIAAHRGPLGIYCYSLGCSALDIDEGPPGPVVDAARQLENYITDYPSLGGAHGPDAAHLWLRDRQPRKASSKVTGFLYGPRSGFGARASISFTNWRIVSCCAASPGPCP